MPRYAYQTPRARTYAYNLDYYRNYYKPMLHYLDKDVKAAEKPGAQTFAEVKPPSLSTLHPYRLPVEDQRVDPHEGSEWPQSVPHFSLVSSYDLMVKFVGIERK